MVSPCFQQVLVPTPLPSPPTLYFHTFWIISYNSSLKAQTETFITYLLDLLGLLDLLDSLELLVLPDLLVLFVLLDLNEKFLFINGFIPIW